MTRFNPHPGPLPKTVGLAWLVSVIYTASLCLVTGVDTNAPVHPDKTTPRADPKPKAASAPNQRKRTGAELYALHCNRCHPERYANEWTSGQWKTVLTHMRVRANLPAAQAREILKFLQENSGN